MAVRQHLVEISIAFLIAGCIFFFYDSPSAERNTPSNNPFNIFDVAHRSPEIKKLHMNRLQNCSTAAIAAGALFNVTYINSVTGAAQWYLVNSTEACAKPPSVPESVAQTQVVNPFPYVSVKKYFLSLNVDCAVGAQAIINRIAAIMLIDPAQLVLGSTVCGSLTLSFSCGSASSVDDAESICSKIVTSACTPNSMLNQDIKATSCGVQQAAGGGSSTSLYALFALTAIPILCLAFLLLWWRSGQRDADNQYMQDTATFSNVAASPQPLGTTEYVAPAATYTQQPTPTPV